MPRRRCWPRPTAAFPTRASCSRDRASRRLTGKSLPSRPRFVLQLYVADPALLLSSYWRHALLLAGLVAASAFAALIGVVASWRAFQRQLRLNELKSNFVSSVSHELRSPIASVRLMAESLERGKVSEAPKQQEYFRFIVQECRRLSSLIENVLDFSRIEQGRKQYDFEPTDLVALTQQTVKLMETYAAERGVKLQLQLSRPSTLNSQPLNPLGRRQSPPAGPGQPDRQRPQALAQGRDGDGGAGSAKVRKSKVQSRAPSIRTRITHHTHHASSSGSRTTAKAFRPPSTRRSSSASTGAAPSCGARPRAWALA